jgi:hypothetical protein
MKAHPSWFGFPTANPINLTLIFPFRLGMPRIKVSQADKQVGLSAEFFNVYLEKTRVFLNQPPHVGVDFFNPTLHG